MTEEGATPIRQQYLEIKRKYPDAILFFRLGDFYETFDDDAATTARELDIVLTSRNVAKGARVPMAGIPYHAAESYLARLVDKGFRVAVCEQVGSSPVNGLFPRQVVRVVTPGTLVEQGLLPGDANNYLAAVVFGPASGSGLGREAAGLAYTDVSTGEFAVTEVSAAAVRAELVRLHPAETIVPDSQPDILGATIASDVDDRPAGRITLWPASRSESAPCAATLLSHFRVDSLDALGLRGRALCATAAGVILQYVKETRPDALSLLTRLKYYALSDFMVLDPATRRNLELDRTLRGAREGSLLGVLDLTITPMGKRLINKWLNEPLLDVKRIEARQAGVQHFIEDGLQRVELRSALKPLADIERTTNRIASGLAQPRDLAALRTSLEQTPRIADILEAQGASLPPLRVPQDQLKLLQTAIADQPPATLQSTGCIRGGYSAELDGVIDASRHAREWIASLETSERARTGLKTLRVGYNKVFGYYIEISRAAAAQAPEQYVRKQTLVNAERFITPEMKEYEALVLNAEEQIRQIEARVFRDVCEGLAAASGELLQLGRALAELDVLAAMAEVAALGGYCRPEMHEGQEIEIYDGRHPVVERTIRGGEYVPNDLVFGEGEIIRILTGPNMSGKSTYLRQAALIVLMAQAGAFVPARRARIGLVDRIFTRIGAQDEIHAGQSTFMVEMLEAANILQNATGRSLLILDEIGRGTSTYDGLAIAWAVVEFIHNHPRLRAKTLFATHYHELTQLAELLPGVRNYRVAVSEVEQRVVFLRKIIQGGADKSYGIHVAQLAGLPAPVIARANAIMAELEKTSGRAVRADHQVAQQMDLFPETNPLVEELKRIDIETLSPLEALNKLFEWRARFLE